MTPMVDREAQITLFISEKLNEGVLEASLYYGDEGEIGSFVIPLFFSSTVSPQLPSLKNFRFLTNDSLASQ